MQANDHDLKPINKLWSGSDTLQAVAHSKNHLVACMRILRLNEVINLTGLSRSTIYHYISKNLFPQQIKLGLRAVGWRYHEIQYWINQK